MNKKRWWAGFGLGFIAALVLLVLTLVWWPSNDAVKPLLAFLVGGIISSVVCYYTGFGEGRQEYGHTWSDCTRAYTNSYLAVSVPPYPFVGGVASGYWALFVVFIGTTIVCSPFIK